mgnify:CR=1 FL=1
MSAQQQQQKPTDRQLDQILGCIYGNALGDAIGLATEFMDSKEVKKVFGDLNKKLIDFPNVDHKSYHSIRWITGGKFWRFNKIFFNIFIFLVF